jgi:dGTPase
LFKKVSTHEGNPKWEPGIFRLRPLYKKPNDIRSEFARDYTRILHSTAYRRLKHKTQVFFATRNDHVCTRIEHVTHVASVSYTIANYLGLNTELTNAIALGHDVGHAPFGHAGESFLKEIVANEIGETFWHERNSLRFVR